MIYIGSLMRAWLSWSARTGRLCREEEEFIRGGWLIELKIVQSYLVRIIISVMYLQSAVEGYTV